MTNIHSRFCNLTKKKMINQNKNYFNIENKIKSFRMQEEFGPKKHIKP